MNGLIMKDLINIKPTLKYVVLMLLVFGVLFVPLGNIYTFDMMVVVFSLSLIANSIAADEMINWDKFALTMPLERGDIINSKFILLGYILLTSLIVCLAASLLAFGWPLETEFLLVFTVVAATGAMAGSVSIPLIYRFGVEKYRFLLVAIMAGPLAAILLVSGVIGIEFSGALDSEMGMMIGLTVTAITFVTVLISYVSAHRIYDKKEF